MPTPTTDAFRWRRVHLAEFIGSLLLAAVVVGSGIAAQSLSPNDLGMELLENAAATGTGLFVLILVFRPVSGAHFNPVVSFVDATLGGISWAKAVSYSFAQILGCIAGAAVANLMFQRTVISLSTDARMNTGHAFSEVIATAGLIVVIFALTRTDQDSATPAAVGSYIGAAYFFTSSTSFANPALTVGRMFSNTFAGIAPSSVPAFIGAQVVGGAAALILVKALFPDERHDASMKINGEHVVKDPQ